MNKRMQKIWKGLLVTETQRFWNSFPVQPVRVAGGFFHIILFSDYSLIILNGIVQCGCQLLQANRIIYFDNYS